MPKFDTCFFERYAKISLEAILGQKYAHLLNEDRPDLQDPIQSLGIEVTRAMRENKKAAQDLVDEIKGITSTSKNQQKDENEQLHYTFGLHQDFYIGSLEYDYWCLALPLQRILKSKVEKVGNGFYGDFQEFGLYVFSKDDMNYEEIYTAMNYTIDLQKMQQQKYRNLYFCQIQELSICDLQQHQIQQFGITKQQSEQFYQKAIHSDV